MWSASQLLVLKDGSCAIGNREPCQVGNQAALSGAFDVPQGSLFGASVVVNAHKSNVEVGVYDLIDRPKKSEGVNACRIARFSLSFFKRREATCIRRYTESGVRAISTQCADRITSPMF